MPYFNENFLEKNVTGDDASLALCFGVAPTENLDYQRFFINKPFDLNCKNEVVIISDREKGLALAIKEEIPNVKHSFCVFHIEKNIKTRFKTDTNGLLWKASKVICQTDFEMNMNQLRNEKGSGLESFLKNISLETWATAYFPVPRYGHIT